MCHEDDRSEAIELAGWLAITDLHSSAGFTDPHTPYNVSMRSRCRDTQFYNFIIAVPVHTMKLFSSKNTCICSRMNIKRDKICNHGNDILLRGF